MIEHSGNIIETMDTLIFCVSVNCSKITSVMLKSFHEHHPNNKIHIIGTANDFEELAEIGKHENNVFVNVGADAELMERFKRGHAGTAMAFAMVIHKRIGGEFDRFLHIDTDIYFKKPCVGIVENAFSEGYDIVGTRRCFKNNPSGISGLDGFPDTVSTYFFGMKLEKIPKFGFEELCRICEGAAHPIEGWMALDFFDGLTHAVMQNGGKVKFLDQNEFGSQNIDGKKTNDYKSNMHMDCGSKLIHFGGVGSGLAYFSGKSNPQAGYASWAVQRYIMFCKLFYNETVGVNEPTVYGNDSRWINGGWDENIFQQLLIDLKN